MANTIADKLARLEQTKQELYDALRQKSTDSFSRDPFSVYPRILQNLKVLRNPAEISSRNLVLNITNGSGDLNISNISTSGSEIVVALNGRGDYGGPGYGGSVSVSGQIVIPFL